MGRNKTFGNSVCFHQLDGPNAQTFGSPDTAGGVQSIHSACSRCERSFVEL